MLGCTNLSRLSRYRPLKPDLAQNFIKKRISSPCVIQIIKIRHPSSVIQQSNMRLFETTVLDRHLGSGSINPAELDSLVVGESVHRSGRNVETSSSMVDGQDVDALSLVGKLPAGTAASRVPASNCLSAADVGELGDVALGLPAVLGDETVLAVGA